MFLDFCRENVPDYLPSKTILNLETAKAHSVYAAQQRPDDYGAGSANTIGD